MSDNLPLLSLLTFSPLLGILIIALLPKDLGKWIRIVGISASALPLLFAVWVYTAFDRRMAGLQFEDAFTWLKVPFNKDMLNPEQVESYYLSFQYHLGVDGLSLPLVFLTSLISLFAAFASVQINKRWKSYFIWLLILQIGMYGVFLAKDVILFFIFFEITLIPAFFLISIWGYKEREKSALQFLIYNGVGSALMLIAFVLLVATAGFQIVQMDHGLSEVMYTGDWEVIMSNLSDPAAFVNMGMDQFSNPFHLSENMRWLIFVLLLIAFGIKLPIFPFHSWMLKVHTEAPTALVMIHSGILLKMGAYGLIRFGVMMFPEQAKSWAFILALLGLINILYGAILAMIQTEFKLLLAYSSISHMGIVLFGIAAFNAVGFQGAIIQLISHGFISALLFMTIGSIYERTKTTRLENLGGLARSAPFISGIMLIGGLASLGLPGLSGFVSEFLSFLGLFESLPIVTAFGTLGIIFTAAYVLRGVLSITFGQQPQTLTDIRDARFIEALPMIAMVAFILLIGIYPAVVSDPLQITIQSMLTRIGG